MKYLPLSVRFNKQKQRAAQIFVKTSKFKKRMRKKSVGDLCRVSKNDLGTQKTF